ncbi:hypothetical protein JCM11251_006433 [Rhodosporidiobolus azoricus]
MSRRLPEANPRDPATRSPSPTATRRPAEQPQPPLISSSSSSGPQPTSTAASQASSLGLGVPPSEGGGGRTPRGSSTARRSSRRASLDPYPSASSRQESPEHSLRPPDAGGGGGSRRVSRGKTPAGETVQEEPERRDMEVEGEERGGVQGQTVDMNFRLVVLQQPEIGAAAGMGKNTLGRLPIVPAPVVELIVQDQRGERIDQEFPFLFCSCSLRQADGVSPVEVARPPSPDEEADAPSPPSSSSAVNDEFSALVGGIVRQSHRVEDLDGNQKDVFVFEDVSVRTRGEYTLEFTLGEAVRPKSPKLAAARSAPFDVVRWEEYPGRPVADTVPELSLHLRKQGVPMYIPPLLLSQPSDNPPPAGSNPFPPVDDSAPVAPPRVEGEQR